MNAMSDKSTFFPLSPVFVDVVGVRWWEKKLHLKYDGILAIFMPHFLLIFFVRRGRNYGSFTSILNCVLYWKRLACKWYSLGKREGRDGSHTEVITHESLKLPWNFPFKLLTLASYSNLHAIKYTILCSANVYAAMMNNYRTSREANKISISLVTWCVFEFLSLFLFFTWH